MRSTNFPTRLDGTYPYKDCLHLSNKETTTAIEVATNGLGNRECKPRPGFQLRILRRYRFWMTIWKLAACYIRSTR